MQLKFRFVGAVIAASAIASSAPAASLTLDMSASTTYQQTQNSPCLIGDPSCNNPSGFGSTTLASNTSTYSDIGSPTYTIQQIRDLV